MTLWGWAGGTGTRGARGGFAGARRGQGSLRGGGTQPAHQRRVATWCAARLLLGGEGFIFPPFSFPISDVRMFIELRLNLRPVDAQPGKQSADRVKGPSPAPIIHPGALIQAVRTNMRTRARGGAGGASRKLEGDARQPPAASRGAAARERGDARGPPQPPGRGAGPRAAPAASPACPRSPAGTEADLRSCRKYICYWERFDISHVKRLRAGGAQASGRKLP